MKRLMWPFVYLLFWKRHSEGLDPKEAQLGKRSTHQVNRQQINQTPSGNRQSSSASAARQTRKQ